jgi:hypothetical protein
MFANKPWKDQTVMTNTYYGWVTHSEVALPERGPDKWNRLCTHNPTVMKLVQRISRFPCPPFRPPHSQRKPHSDPPPSFSCLPHS